MGDLLGRVPVLNQEIASHITFAAAGRYTILSVGKVGDMRRSITCIVALAGKGQNATLDVLSWIEGEAP